MLVHENMTSESINMKKHDYYVNRTQFSRGITCGGTGPVLSIEESEKLAVTRNSAKNQTQLGIT